MVMETTALAGDASLFASYGRGSCNVNLFRLGLTRRIPWQSLERISKNLGLRAEIGYSFWNRSGDDIHVVALTPVWFYGFEKRIWGGHPYIEGGIGVALLNDFVIGNRNLSSHFQFEDILGVGIDFGSMGISLRFHHYSNAGIMEPNPGIDLFLSNVHWRF